MVVLAATWRRMHCGVPETDYVADLPFPAVLRRQNPRPKLDRYPSVAARSELFPLRGF